MWVFTDGRVRKGRWIRPDREQPAHYVDANGQPDPPAPGPHLGRAPAGRYAVDVESPPPPPTTPPPDHAAPTTTTKPKSEVAAPVDCGAWQSRATTGTARVKRGLAEMLRGGVIMDVVTAEQAKIAEDAGAVAVMALERVPADIRRDGGVARMSDPAMIEGIQAAVTIPVMAKCRIGHFAEAQVLEALGVDYIDESEVLTPADDAYHVDKWAFTVPFVCGATNLGEALRRISEGACMIRSKGEAGTGDVSVAVHHLRSILGDIRKLTVADSAELFGWAKELRAPVELVQEVAERGELPVPLFCAGGIATPADAALVMQLGAQAVFVGSGIFKSYDPATVRQGDRRGHHPLQRRRDRGQGVARPRRRDARRRDRHRSTSSSPTRCMVSERSRAQACRRRSQRAQ